MWEWGEKSTRARLNGKYAKAIIFRGDVVQEAESGCAQLSWDEDSWRDRDGKSGNGRVYYTSQNIGISMDDVYPFPILTESTFSF